MDKSTIAFRFEDFPVDIVMTGDATDQDAINIKEQIEANETGSNPSKAAVEAAVMHLIPENLRGTAALVFTPGAGDLKPARIQPHRAAQSQGTHAMTDTPETKLNGQASAGPVFEIKLEEIRLAELVEERERAKLGGFLALGYFLSILAALYLPWLGAALLINLVALHIVVGKRVKRIESEIVEHIERTKRESGSNASWRKGDDKEPAI